MEEEFDPFLEEPLARQVALAQRVRRSPAITMPSSAVETPPPASGAGYGGQSFDQAQSRWAGGTPQPQAQPSDDYARADALREQAQAGPAETDIAALRQFAKERDEQAQRSFKTGLALQAFGGESFAPAGEHVLRQALASQDPMKFGGGIIERGQFVADPQVTAQNRTARLEAQAKVLEARAARAETREEREQARREAAALRRELAGGRNDAATASNRSREEDRMYKLYEASTKTFREELDATGKVAQLAPGMLGRRPNAIEQQSLAVLLNKFLDPGSVVREGEFDRVARAQGYYDRVANLRARIQSGEPMSDKLIAEIVGMAQFYEKAARAKLQRIGDETTRKAVDRGLDPANVIIDPYYTPGTARQEIPEGAVRPRNAPPPRRATDAAPDEPPPGAVRPR